MIWPLIGVKGWLGSKTYDSSDVSNDLAPHRGQGMARVYNL